MNIRISKMNFNNIDDYIIYFLELVQNDINEIDYIDNNDDKLEMIINNLNGLIYDTDKTAFYSLLDNSITYK